MFSFFWSNKNVVNVQKERKNVSDLALGIASITFFTIVAQIVLAKILTMFLQVSSFSTTASLFINAVTMYGIAMPLSMIFFGRCEVAPVEKKRLGFFMLVGLVAVCFALTYVGSIAGTLIEELTAALAGREASNPVAETVSEISLWSVFLFMVVLAPIFEEIFFRKVVIDRLRRYGDLPAIIISGLVFGVIHGNFSQFFYAALLGMVFGAIYVHTGKLGYTIFLHMLINFMGSFYTTLMMDQFGGEIPLEFTDEIIEAFPVGYRMMNAYSTVYTLSFFFAIPALVYFLQQLRLRKGDVILKGRDRRRVVLCNLGFWLSAAFLLWNFSLSI